VFAVLYTILIFNQKARPSCPGHPQSAGAMRKVTVTATTREETESSA